MTGTMCLISKSSHLLLKTPVYQVEAILIPCFTCISRDYSTNASIRSSNSVDVIRPRLSNLHLQRTFPVLDASYLLNRRLYSSSAGSRGEKVAASSSSGSGVSDTSGFDVNELVSKVKEAWNSSLDVVSQTGEKAKEVFGEVSPHVEKFFDANPYLRDVIAPVFGTIAGTIAAWVILPRIFRRFHKYSTEGSGAFLPAGSLWGAVPYEDSIWRALELPVRYLITFMAFSQIGMMIAPTTIASQFIGPAWRAGVIISFIWFLLRWKTNVVTRVLVSKSNEVVDRSKLLTLDKFSSVGLFVLGGMALAEACGVAVQSILTVGGIGGVATAFAARDILGNVLSGLSIQLSQPFSIGDTIKAGSVEGKVQSMGLTTTSLLSTEKFPVVVPNSLFSSQVIVNKSRAEWRTMVSKIPVQIDDFDKIPKISEEIKKMMQDNANVYLEQEKPYCYVSRVGRSFAELIVGCNLIKMRKELLLSTEQDILLQSVAIIKNNGAMLA